MTEVAPKPLAGWEVRSVPDPARPSGVSQAVWSGGSLPADEVGTFSIQGRFPDTPGERLWFKVVQSCREGELRWVEIPGPGEHVDDFEHPAAYVDLVAPGRSKAEQSVAQGRSFAWAGFGGMVLLAAIALAAVRAGRGRAP
jgi:uncharacterized protein YcnI